MKITPKRIWLLVIVLLVVGVIAYLESMKAGPAAGGGANGAQAINIPANGTTTASTSASTSVAAAVAQIAATDQAAGYKPAIEIQDPTGFINASSDFRLANLIGKKVILLDFWTYSCINCIRTLPYLTSWYGKYKNEGLVVVGIHTPEFDFEKDIANVQAAAAQYGITYPIVLDSNYGTWDAYGNLYWPHEYLIDIAGYIVHDQVGEGNYDETESKIQQLLAQRATVLGLSQPAAQAITMPDQPDIEAESQETYFGSNRNEYLGNGTQGIPGMQTFSLPPSSSLAADTLYLGGTWNVEPEYAQTASDTGTPAPGAGAVPDEIEYEYEAKGFYFVAGAASGTAPINIEVLRDGKPVDPFAAGSDIFYQNGKSYVKVGENRLYRIIDEASPGEHVMQFIIPSGGLQAYTFTFG